MIAHPSILRVFRSSEGVPDAFQTRRAVRMLVRATPPDECVELLSMLVALNPPDGHLTRHGLSNEVPHEPLIMHCWEHYGTPWLRGTPGFAQRFIHRSK